MNGPQVGAGTAVLAATRLGLVYQVGGWLLLLMTPLLVLDRLEFL